MKKRTIISETEQTSRETPSTYQLKCYCGGEDFEAFCGVDPHKVIGYLFSCRKCTRVLLLGIVDVEEKESIRIPPPWKEIFRDQTLTASIGIDPRRMN